MAAYSAAQRRQAIAVLLEGGREPVSAAALARQFSVSRQVIVGDVALLRAAGAAIQATPRGYVTLPAPDGPCVVGQVACLHRPEDMGRELRAMVDAGGEVADVVVEHPVYGQITAPLRLRSRYEVEAFLQRVADKGAKPLSALTDGVHLHTVRCPDQETMDRVLAALDREGLRYR